LDRQATWKATPEVAVDGSEIWRENHLGMYKNPGFLPSIVGISPWNPYETLLQVWFIFRCYVSLPECTPPKIVLPLKSHPAKGKLSSEGPSWGCKMLVFKVFKGVRPGVRGNSSSPSAGA